MDYALKPLALVTGASSGIGYQLAIQFAQHGYDLLVVSGTNAIRDAAEDLRVFGTEVQAAQIDLATLDGVDKLNAHIRASGRPLAVAAINAGVGVGGRFCDTDLKEELNLLNLNVIGTWHLAKHVTQYMIASGEGGKILFTSSIASLMPGPYEAVYSASKAFVQSLAMSLHFELKDKGISVTAVLPGPTDTNFFRRAGMHDTKVGTGDKDDPAHVAATAFKALMDGKHQVLVGGLATKLQGGLSAMLPDQMKAARHADMAEPGSGQKHH